jgi:NAD(P)-dependent dehydrogenase (short-subunit alcohol dehydrogenase family)
MKKFQHKVALITGSAQGIGAAIARIFTEEGAFVFISDINESKGMELVTELGRQACFIPLDVRNENHWIDAMKKIKKMKGEMHILVNNAGVTGYQEALGPQNPEEISLESWCSVHDTNLTGTFLGCKYGIISMKNNNSHSTIINISSRSGIVGIPHAAAYASSKAAIRNHTKSVALYCAEKKYPITCNSIHPAAIRTPMWEPMLNNGEEVELQFSKMSEHIPLKHFGTPHDVAYAAAFLAADEAKYLTGIELNVDGGILAGAVASPSSN